MDIRLSLSKDLSDLVKERTEELKISNQEYLRMLIRLDIAIKKYQKMTLYIDSLSEKINEYHDILGIYATPLLCNPYTDLLN